LIVIDLKNACVFTKKAMDISNDPELKERFTFLGQGEDIMPLIERRIPTTSDLKIVYKRRYPSTPHTRKILFFPASM